MLGYVIKTIKELLSNKRNLIVVLIGVILVGGLALLTGKSNQNEIKNKTSINIGVVDNDHSIYSSLILDYFKKTESITKFANISLDSQKNIEDRFKKGELLAYLVIPKDFANSLMGTDYVAIDAVINTSNVMYSVLLKNMLDSYGSYITNVQVVSGGLYHIGKVEGMTPENLDKMNWDTSVDLIQLALNRDMFFDKNEVENIPATPILQYYIWAILVLLIMLTATLSGSRFLKERQMGAYERLQIAGHSVRSIALVIQLMNSVLWILCYHLLLPAISRFMKCSITMDMYIYIDVCIVLANSVFLLIALLCSNNQQYAILCTFGLMLLSVVGGILIPIGFLPERFLAYSRLTPTYYMIQNLVGYSKGINTMDISTFALCILGFVVVFYGITCILLSHQRNNRRGKCYEAME